MQILLSWLIARTLEISVGGALLFVVTVSGPTQVDSQGLLIGMGLVGMGYLITGYGPLTLLFASKLRHAPGWLVVANLASGFALVLAIQAFMGIRVFPDAVSILLHGGVVGISTMAGVTLVHWLWPEGVSQST